VKAGMGIAAVLCAAAVLRVTVARSARETQPTASPAAVQIEPLANAAERTPFTPSAPAMPLAAAEIGARIPLPPPDPDRDPDPEPEEGPGEAPHAISAPAAATAAPVATGATPATAVADSPAVASAARAEAPPPATAAAPPSLTAGDKAKSAAQEKRDARTLLERYRAKDAILAGERAVALDPTDGEAWLILGAAYQEAGQLDGARRAFQACLKQAKRGPVDECRAMLE
jgi:tetratricopeptide (TPR) repeat protein